jgi:O-antigen ligase
MIKKEDSKQGALILGLIGIAIISVFLGLFFSAQAGLLLLAGAWAAAFSWKYPKRVFWLLLFFVPILSILKITETFSLVTPLKDFIIVALFLRVVIFPILRKEDPYRRNAILVPIILLVVCAIIGALRADSHLLGILRLRDILLYIPMLWIARGLIVSRKDFVNFLKVIFATVSLVLSLAFIQLIFFADGTVLRLDPSNGSWIPRASSVLAHPNNLGSYLIIILPIVFAFAWRKFKFFRERILAVLIAIAGAIIVYSTYSRSVWMAFAVTILALILINVRQRKKNHVKYFIFGAIVVAIGVFAFPRVGNLLRTVVDPTYGSNSERLQILTDLVASSTNTSTLIGRGLGDIYQGTDREINISLSDIVSADTQNVRTAKDRTFVDNAVIKTWTETGLAGLIIVSFLLWRVLCLAWGVAINGKTDKEKTFAVGFFSATIGLVVMSFFLDIPEVFPIALYWWTFIGILEASTYLKDK